MPCETWGRDGFIRQFRTVFLRQERIECAQGRGGVGERAVEVKQNRADAHVARTAAALDIPVLRGIGASMHGDEQVIYVHARSERIMARERVVVHAGELAQVEARGAAHAFEFRRADKFEIFVRAARQQL